MGSSWKEANANDGGPLFFFSGLAFLARVSPNWIASDYLMGLTDVFAGARNGRGRRYCAAEQTSLPRGLYGSDMANADVPRWAQKKITWQWWEWLR